MTTILTPSLQEAREALINNLLASEIMIRYHQAQCRLNQDLQAQNLLAQLSQAQTDLRQTQANGGVIQYEIERVLALQEQVQGNPVILDFSQSQQEAINLLREINDEISQLLGINFASFSNRQIC